MIGKHDPARFGDIGVAATAPFTSDEETSGVIDVADILGAGIHLLVDQAHYPTSGQAVEGTSVNLGTPATADNCSVASVTNNAPASFPAGTTTVTWTVTDGGGNTATASQVVIVTSYTITASAGTGGSISPNNITTLCAGSNLVYTITPDPCYHVEDVLVDGVSVGAVTNYTFSNVTGNHTISATFALNTYSVTYTAGTGGSIGGISPQTKGLVVNDLQLQAYPNPANNYFTLVIQSSKQEKIQMKVSDLLGRLVEMKTDILPNTTIELGWKYFAGIYIVEIVQGNERRVVKLIKIR